MWIYARLLLSLCFVLLLYTTYCSRSLLIPVYRVELEEIGKFNLWLVSGDLLSRQKSTLLLVRVGLKFLFSYLDCFRSAPWSVMADGYYGLGA